MKLSIEKFPLVKLGPDNNSPEIHQSPEEISTTTNSAPIIKASHLSSLAPTTPLSTKV
jgi:hypothetical protein